MGTINFKSSEFITLGIEPFDIDGYLNDLDFRSWCEESGLDPEEEVYNQIEEDYKCDYDNCESVLKNYDFRFFNLSLEWGYYESFSLNIEFNVWCFDNYEQKREAQKEITKIKACLFDLIGMGMVECFPGWCTSYLTIERSKRDILQAVKDMREAVKNTKTDKTFVWNIA